MASKLFEFRATRRRAGGLATGIDYLVWEDEAATQAAEIYEAASETTPGSLIADSTVTTTDIAGLGPAAVRFFGPADGQDTLFVTCPSDASLGVQEVEAKTDPRLDALEGLVGDATAFARKPATGDTIYYVTASGNDANDGRSWGSAKATIQAAYDALPAAGAGVVGGGIINIGPGRFDVGSGLALDRRKHAVFVGSSRPRRYLTSSVGTGPTYSGHGATVLYSSTGAVALVNFDLPAATVINANGFEFHQLVFEMTAAATLYGIRAPDVNHAVVDNCQFWMGQASDITNQAVGIYAYVDTALGNDASWWRVTNNVCATGALCIFGPDTGTTYNSNQHVIKNNVIFGWGATETTARAAIKLRGATRCVVRDNNIEGFNVGVLLDASYLCTVDGDGGEQVKYFVDLVNGDYNWINPAGSTNVVTVADSRLVRADAASAKNVIAVRNGKFTGGTVADALELSGIANRDNRIVSFERELHPNDLVLGPVNYRESYTRYFARDNHSLTSGVMLLVALPLFIGDVVTSLTFVSGTSTALTMGTNNDGHLWFALYDSALNLLAQTADQGGAATWAINTIKTLALQSAQAIPSTGLYYVGVMVNAGTGGSPATPQVRGNALGQSTMTNSTGWPTGVKQIAGTNGSGLGASAPAGPLTLAATSNCVYCLAT